jgi:hypothetical protein
MRPRLLNILTVAALMLCVASAALWIWAYRDTRFVYSRFAKGHYDGDRSWSGSYLGVSRGQLVFEREEISYATRPASAPTGRWAAEDAANVRTPALRSFPFDGPLGFHFMHDRAVSNAGSVRVLRVGIPLWSVLLVSSVPLVVRVGRFLRRRRASRASVAATPT